MLGGKSIKMTTCAHFVGQELHTQSYIRTYVSLMMIPHLAGQWLHTLSYIALFTHMGHSMSNQRKKSTPISDFSETWFLHSLYRVIKPQ